MPEEILTPELTPYISSLECPVNAGKGISCAIDYAGLFGSFIVREAKGMRIAMMPELWQRPS